MSAHISPAAARAVEQLSRLGQDFAALHHQLCRDQLVAGIESLPALATRYANAQGLTAASLSLLLSVAEQSWAHEVRDGRSAFGDLGHLTRAAGEATACISGAAARAAEFHRINGQREPVTPQPARHHTILDLTRAAALLTDAPALCASASRSIEAAAQTDEPPSTGPDTATDPTLTGAPVKVTDTQHRALATINRYDVRVYMGLNHRRSVTTGGPADRITLRTAEALLAKGLIRQDYTTSLYTGQRLHLTARGRHTLHSLGPAPAARAVAPPVRAVARAR
ncbi:hypothetical protein ACFYUL_19420 [Streptomyces sp. NPDC004311]|uniref:hypothetical protein n=1 Tax=Streptomyces sp. NPDC004311 TaxID=3364698 RepID=UPI00367F575D